MHIQCTLVVFYSFFFKILFIFREQETFIFRERERNISVREKHHSVASPTGDLACNSDTCPDWELNQWPFGLQASAQPTELHQPGHFYSFLKC